MYRRRLSQLRNRRIDLWADSDEEVVVPGDEAAIVLSDEEVIILGDSPEPNISPNVNAIVTSSQPDVNTTVTSTQPDEQPFLPAPMSPLLSFSVRQQQTTASYIPRTLQQDSRRYSILPAFPTSIYNAQPSLLLANVPVHKLNQAELARRRPGVYPLGYTINEKNFDIPSDFRNSYQSFTSSLIYQYNVDEAILDYNLYRLSECFRTFAEDYLRRHKCNSEEFKLDEEQKRYAFEFYLQIDVDLFYMKTCSFRNAKPRSVDEGLFCIDEPDIPYGLSPCNNCPLCIPSYDIARRQPPTIQFGPSQNFRFINGYRTILNCPVNCQTQNIIYVMTCPCGEFEYIGETSQRIGDRLRYHRQHFNRIIHEFLISEENVKFSQPQDKDAETITKDRMVLYKHAARCPSAIQIFLNFNPIYWCFVPITMNEAIQQSRNYVVPSSLVLLDSINPTSIACRDRRAVPETSDTRADEEVRSCMRNIPPLPPGYTYSTRQRIEQFQYFKDKLDVTTGQNESMNLFKVAIIAVLPVDVSKGVRRFIESLFITHTETRLNTSGRLLHQNDDENNDGNAGNIYPMPTGARIVDRGQWCRNVVYYHYQ